MCPEEGDFPENLHRVVYVIINKHSFECFICFALVIYKKQFVFSQPEFEYLRAEVSWFAPYLYEERKRKEKSRIVT